MSVQNAPLEEIISAVDRLRRILTKQNSPQIRGSQERSLVKATALSWFHSARSNVQTPEESVLQKVDNGFRKLLEFSDSATSQSRYNSHLKELRKDLINLRSQIILPVTKTGARFDQLELSKLIADIRMQEIITRRLNETRICVEQKADLAAIVMMGALLEALFLARVNRLADKSPLFRLKCTPKDGKTGKAIPLTEWTLKNFIDAAHEVRWIRQSARDVGNVLRDYRNYIHPEKELSHGISLNSTDTKMFLAIFWSLAEQIIDSIAMGG